MNTVTQALSLRILDSAAVDFDAELERLIAFEVAQDADVDSAVASIIDDVRARGDAALIDYTRRFDGLDVARAEELEIPHADLREAFDRIGPADRDALAAAAMRIRVFHERQKTDGFTFREADGTELGQRVTPLDRVGLYIPGGKAAYPSSVLMNAIPAQVAGVERIVVVTPPRSLEENPLVAAALKMLNVTEVYRVGGAQSIGALAYGTGSIPRVQKIVGPGNQYVQSAKRQVYGAVDIDMVAGPSEVAIVADETCDPAWIAADLVAQAEHDENSGVWLVCWSKEVAAAVFDQIQVQLETLDRAPIARTALVNRGMTFIVSDEDSA